MIGSLGLAVDVGRLYIVKSESQAFADSAAVDAALQLDGKTSGLNDARAVVAANLNRANLGESVISGVVPEFATSAAGPWYPNPSPPSNYVMVRVVPTVNVQMLFMPLIAPGWSRPVSSRAIAGQVLKTTFKEGLFPFSPYAHDPNAQPDLGLVLGRSYTLRWPANPRLTGNSNVCPGDRVQSVVDISNAAGGSERGYIESTSADLIRQTIINDYQSVTRVVGDLVDMTGGAKQSQLESLQTRILQDSDATASNFSSYRGNGRRIVAVPINDGGTPLGSNNRIVGIRAFFLSAASEYGVGGGQAWCAEYIGAYVQGSRKPGAGNPGSYAVRLVD